MCIRDRCIANAADEGPLTQHGMGLGSYIDVDKVKEEMRSNGNTLLAQALAKAQAAGCKKAEVLLIESAQKRLGDMIIGAATQWGADLIVMGTQADVALSASWSEVLPSTWFELPQLPCYSFARTNPYEENQKPAGGQPQ